MFHAQNLAFSFFLVQGDGSREPRGPGLVQQNRPPEPPLSRKLLMNLNILEKKQDSCAENKVSSVSFAGFSQADENVQGSRRRGIFSAKEELMRKDAVRIGVFCL